MAFNTIKTKSSIKGYSETTNTKAGEPLLTTKGNGQSEPNAAMECIKVTMRQKKKEKTLLTKATGKVTSLMAWGPKISALHNLTFSYRQIIASRVAVK